MFLATHWKSNIDIQPLHWFIWRLRTAQTVLGVQIPTGPLLLMLCEDSKQFNVANQFNVASLSTDKNEEDKL
jgi:hypothetical protein